MKKLIIFIKLLPTVIINSSIILWKRLGGENTNYHIENGFEQSGSSNTGLKPEDVISQESENDRSGGSDTPQLIKQRNDL